MFKLTVTLIKNFEGTFVKDMVVGVVQYIVETKFDETKADEITMNIYGPSEILQINSMDNGLTAVSQNYSKNVWAKYEFLMHVTNVD